MAGFYAKDKQEFDEYVERAVEIVGFKDRLKDKVGIQIRYGKEAFTGKSIDDKTQAGHTG